MRKRNTLKKKKVRGAEYMICYKMTPEPLKGKMQGLLGTTDEGKPKGRPVFYRTDIKSAVEGIIKFHEDRIEELKKTLKSGNGYERECCNLNPTCFKDTILDKIKREKVSIVAIEHWLEDVV